MERRLYLLLAAALLLSGLALAWVFLVPSPDEFMTEFYMLGPEGLAENFPREVAVGEVLGVTLGLANRERGDQVYRVEAWAVDPFAEDRRALVAQDGPYPLSPGQTREWPLTWQMPWAGDDQVVDLLLFTAGETEPYRSLRLWLNVTE